MRSYEYLPAAPLVALVESRRLEVGTGRLARGYFRARAEGRLTVWMADLLAVELLGLHPVMVWPEEWVACSEEARTVSS